MRDMGHEDEEEDDDHNNTNNNDDDDDDDDDNSGDHVPQQQHTITRDHLRTRADKGRRTRGQQSLANLMQQDERPRRISRRTQCGKSSCY